MTYLQLLKLLPELVKIGKSLNEKLKQGITVAQIKRALNGVDKAFKNDDFKSIDSINDIWNK